MVEFPNEKSKCLWLVFGSHVLLSEEETKGRKSTSIRNSNQFVSGNDRHATFVDHL